MFLSDFVIFQISKYLRNKNDGKLNRCFLKSKYVLVLQNMKENTYIPVPFQHVYGMLGVKLCNLTGCTS